MPKKKATGGKKKAAAPAAAPAPEEPEPVGESAPKGGDAGQAAKGLDKVTDGFAKGQEVKADKATMDAAASKLKAQDPAKAEAEQAQR